MKIENKSYDFVEEGPENFYYFDNIASEIANGLLKEKKVSLKEVYAKTPFSTFIQPKKEIEEMLKKIPEKEKNRPRHYLENLFSNEFFAKEAFSCFNSNLKGFNSLGGSKFPDATKNGERSLLGSLWYHVDSYAENLNKAKEHGADISGLPSQLNYLERLN